MASAALNGGPSPVRPASTSTAVKREARSDVLKNTKFIVTLTLETFKNKFLKKARLGKKTKSKKNLTTLRGTIAAITQDLGGISEVAAYEPVSVLFTAICDSYYATEKVKAEDRLAFVVHHTHPPHLHPDPYIDKHAQQKPDIIVVKKSFADVWLKDVRAWRPNKRLNKPAILWALLVSLLEGKKDSGNDPMYQAATYSGSLLQSRPDLPGNFTIAYSASVFRLLWCDPCGVYATPEIPWGHSDACEILLSYVHFLHRPLLIDSTITMQDPNRGHDDEPVAQWQEKSYARPPVWVIRARQVEYEVSRLVHVGEPWSRMNTVWESTHYGHIGDPRVERPAVFIKDSFPDSKRVRRSSEGAILDEIHQNGEYVLGVVINLDHFEVRNNDTVIRNIHVDVLRNDEAIHRRTKVRIIFDGPKLRTVITCESVYEFFKVMYDVLELLTFTHEHRGVLHRDISPYNIMRQIGSAPGTTERKLCKDQPVFIGSLLAYNTLGDRETFLAAYNKPSCLLIDFDNALMENVFTGAPRTGTAAFVARAVNAQRMTGPIPHKLHPIPALTGQAKASYVALFGNEIYDSRSEFHQGLVEPHEAQSLPFTCLPRHDAESCYWVIAWWLMRALPAGANPALDDCTVMNRTFRILEGHAIEGDDMTEYRNVIIAYDGSQWAKVLHPGLHSLVPFLKSLSAFVDPDYALLPDLNPYNLHEAMKRMLLQEIWRLEESGDLLLVQNEQRAFTPSKDGHGATEARNFAKRQFDYLADQAEFTRSKKLKTGSTSTQKPPESSKVKITPNATSTSTRTLRPRGVKKTD